MAGPRGHFGNECKPDVIQRLLPFQVSCQQSEGSTERIEGVNAELGGWVLQVHQFHNRQLLAKISQNVCRHYDIKLHECKITCI